MEKMFKTVGSLDSATKGTVLLRTDLPTMPLLGRGKVRDTYLVNGPTTNLMMVSTDRISAFDVVMNEGVPGKGWILNHLSAFWFERTKHIVDNHFIKIHEGQGEIGNGRSMLVQKVTPLKVEAVVRGYLTGSGFDEYREKGTLWGSPLLPGMKDGDRLPEVVFTPTTKADKGHDMPMTKEEVAELVGRGTAQFIEKKAIELYSFARDLSLKRGLVLADTKFEFGVTEKDDIILIDEALTPDSSRYWLGSEYAKGRLVSLDKQYLRDYLKTTGWNKRYPPPPLPAEIIAKTAERYAEAFKMITGPELRTEQITIE